MLSRSAFFYIVVIVAFLVTNTVDATIAKPCTGSETNCESCTCYDSLEHVDTFGGVFFYEIGYEFPAGWVSHGEGWIPGFLGDRPGLYSKNNDGWLISPPIDTTLVGLKNLTLSFSLVSLEQNHNDDLTIFILKQNPSTNHFFTGDHLDGSGVSLSKSELSENERTNLVKALLSSETGKSFGDAYNDYYLEEFIGSVIRIGFKSNSKYTKIINQLRLYYNRDTILETPTTDDFTSSPPCCGGYDDISLFEVGQMWGGYGRSCNEDLSAIDFYVYEVDRLSKSVKGRTSVLISNSKSSCGGSWTNTLTFFENSQSWVFGDGVPIDGDEVCKDHLSRGKGILCSRGSLCGKIYNDSCEETFSLRRSEKPNEQYAFISYLDRDLLPIQGTMKNRWVAEMAIEHVSSSFFFLDDFGRVHFSKDNSKTKIGSVILNFMIGKDVIGVTSSDKVVFFWTRQGALYMYSISDNLEEAIQERALYVPPIEKVWCGRLSCLARLKTGEMWGWGYSPNGVLGYSSLLDDYLPPSPSPFLNDQLQKNVIVAPIIDIAIGQEHTTIVSSTNELFISGYNVQSELGFYNNDNLDVPTRHEYIAAIIQNCGCGNYHTICTTTSGSGIHFGFGVVFSSSGPVKFSLEGQNITSIKSLEHFNVGIIDDGSVYAWGSSNGILQRYPFLLTSTAALPMANFVPGSGFILLAKDHSLGVTFLKTDITVSETVGIVKIPVKRSNTASINKSLTITVSASVIDDEKLRNVDAYVLLNSTIKWASGDFSTKSIFVQILNNDIYTSDVKIKVAITREGLKTKRYAEITILDDRDAGIICFEQSVIKVKENQGSMHVKIIRTKGFSSLVDVTVYPVLDSGEAINVYESESIEGDYEFRNTTLTWSDQEEVYKLITINIINSDTVEANKFFTISLESYFDVLDPSCDKLTVEIEDFQEQNNTVSSITGASLGAVGASLLIAGFALARVRKAHKERLRKQWLIQYEELTEVHGVDGQKSLTATCIGNDVFLENLDPQISQQDEATFTPYVVLRHPNLVTFVGVVFSPSLLVTEYCSKGGLDEALESGKIPFNTEFKASLCSDAAQGMGYMHAKGIYHGMLDLSKLVVNSRFVCKVTGFILQPWKSLGQSLDAICWQAPELMMALGPQYSLEDYSSNNVVRFQKLDIDLQLVDPYSFGLIMFAIFTENPFPYLVELHQDKDAHFKREALRIDIINTYVRPIMPSYFTDPNTGLWKHDGNEMKVMTQVQRCWAHEPLMRPLFPELIKILGSMLPSDGKLADTMHDKYTTHMECLVSERTNDLYQEKMETEVILSNIHTLIRNILPGHIVDRLQSNPEMIADKYNSVTIFYSEIVDFNDFIKECEVSDIIILLNNMFSRFDNIASENEVERTKTMSDAYIAMCSVDDHVKQVVRFALTVTEEKFEITGKTSRLRIGIETGPLFSGVVGTQRLAYDIWGPTLTTAQSIAHKGLENKVCVSDSVYNKLRHHEEFIFTAAPLVNKGAPVYVASLASNLENPRIRIRGSLLLSENRRIIRKVKMDRKEKMLAVKKMVKAAAILTPDDFDNSSATSLSNQSQSSRSGLRSLNRSLSSKPSSRKSSTNSSVDW